MLVIPAVSVEYLHIPVTSDVTLDAQPVSLAFTATAVRLDDAVMWNDAEWAGDPGTSRTCRLLTGPGAAAAPGPGIWNVWVKVTSSPEIPVRHAGQIKIT